MNTICLSENANRILKDALRDKGFELIEIAGTDKVYDAIASHCDIYLCKIGAELIVAPAQLPLIRDGLRKNGIRYVAGAEDPGLRYPENVRYNAAQMGCRLIYGTKHTDPAVLLAAKENSLELIKVKQGYTKCNLAIVDGDSAITSDLGLAAALKKHGIDILTISQGHVRLEGFPYGFLGGASGRVGDEIVFNGNLSAHPDFRAIEEFIQKKRLRAVWFEEYPLEDIGSIIET
jgi:hypothetical protein